MRIKKLSISNFRGIREAQLENLEIMVIIAGQNGSGKSCIFDAIRLLKSAYGGYQQNEWQQWMGEFQIQISNRSSDFVSMFNDPAKDLVISSELTLSNAERNYITKHADDLLREHVWRTIMPEAYDWGGMRMAHFAAQFRDREPEVMSRVSLLKSNLLAEIVAPTFHAQCHIPVNGTPDIAPSISLELLFSNYRPDHLGVIDYHGAQRHFSRENVQQVNLNLANSEQQRRQNALYNYAQKYNNVKSEMAASYVKEILAEQAGIPRSSQSTLTNTLQELFSTFFPDKVFLGPQATAEGGLRFPVQVGGSTHDLDELSSGEKEILYGYLRIRNSTPSNSIILIDEPELHLNPRLIRGLPQFYRKNIGEDLGNQIWLVSHSDALLREVVARPGYSVFHMLACSSVSPGQGQIRPLAATADLEVALADLVGDLAAYRPGGKVVLFEGGGDSDFDLKVTASFFPELQREANLISGSNKAKVRALHEVLQRASIKGQLPFTFFAIADRDTQVGSAEHVNQFTWDVYHIENYLIEVEHITKVLAALGLHSTPSQEEVIDDLRECARLSLTQLIRHQLAEFANSILVRTINMSTDPSGEDLVGEIEEAIKRSVDKLNRDAQAKLHHSALEQKERQLREKYMSDLGSGDWIKTFRGRDVLRRFVNQRRLKVGYEAFRNLLVSSMRDSGFQPAGMKRIVDQILASP